MGILISLIPWFLFWIFAIYKKMELAAVSGFLAVLVIIIRNRRRGRSLKSLQVGILAFFILLALIVPVFCKEAVAHNVDLLGNSAVLIIILITIIFKRPFALEFARERAEKKNWQDPGFIRAGYIISWFWFGVLSVNFCLVVARHFSFIEIARWLSVLIRIFNCIVAMKISRWYLRRKQIFNM
jgi:hypothetical protein